MRSSGRYAVALVACIGVAVAALVGAISERERDGLPVGELLRIENLVDEPTDNVEKQVKLQVELLNGERQYTEELLESNFTEFFQSQVTVESLNAQNVASRAASGSIQFVRILEHEPNFVGVLGFDDAGEPGELQLVLDDEGLVAGLFVVDVGEMRRIAAWEATLVLVSGWALLTASVVAWRFRATTHSWTMLAASVLALASMLQLTNSSLTYSFGRVLPALVIIPAVVLLVPSSEARARKWLVGGAIVAAIFDVVAPGFRDSTLIAHPDVIGRVTDNDSAYRSLLIASACASAVTMVGTAVMNLARSRRGSASMRPTYWVASTVAFVWAMAASLAIIDPAADGGTWAGGTGVALYWSAVVAVPAAVIFGLVSSSWDRPDLAELVIDLESESSDLRSAIARALADPSLVLLTATDDETLLDEDGSAVLPESLPDGRALTRIRSGQRLVGGLLHSPDLQRDPTRLEAVAAAAGLAIEVGRLNERVVAQLDEVEASRARILEASDVARRRIERDLHDGAQQRLVALGLRLQRARRAASSDHQNEIAELLDEATSEVRGTIEEIRAVSRGAQPALLAERGLAAAVDALAERTPIPVTVDLCVDDLQQGVERTAFYVIAEGLTNIAKHSAATTAQVSISCRGGDAQVTICDDGNGGAEISAGSGLEGLNDRVAATGGTFTLVSDASGTTLEATIPCA